MLISNFISHSIPYLFKLLVDNIGNSSIVTASLYILLVVATGFLSYISLILADRFFFFYSEQFAMDLRKRIIRKLYDSKYSIFNKVNIDTLMRMIVSDAEEMKSKFITFVFSIISIVFNIFSLSFFMLTLDWKLALVCISWNVLFFIFTQNFSKNIQKKKEEERSEYSSIVTLHKDAVQGHHEFRFFSSFQFFQDHLKSFKEKYISKAVKSKLSLSYYNYLPRIGQFLLLAIILTYGFFQARAENFEVSTLLAIFMYTGYFNPILMRIFHIKANYSGIEGIYKPIKDFLEDNSDNGKILDLKTIKKGAIKKIIVQNLSVSFGEDKIIQDLNYQFYKDKIYFIKGKSGAGKSTFIKALLNLIPFKGKVIYNETDIQELPLSYIYEKTGYVQQDVHLLNDKIDNNISLYHPSVTQEEVEKVLGDLKLSYLINSAENTLGTQGSEKVSGGEKKRIGIARLLTRINDKDIIVFDETFSNMDGELKHILIREMENSFKNKIIFVITHEEDTIKLFKDSFMAYETVELDYLRSVVDYNITTK